MIQDEIDYFQNKQTVKCILCRREVELHAGQVIVRKVEVLKPKAREGVWRHHCDHVVRCIAINRIK